MASTATARNAKIDAALKAAADAGDVPGVVAMATDRTSTIYEGAFGKRVLGEPAAMTLDTVVWIASMTKALTGAAAMQLVEQGKLDLDAPAAKVVPDLGKAQVLEGFDADGQPRTRAPKRPITLRHLLTHTAGFGYEIWSEDIADYQTAKNIPGIITCQNAALSTPLLFDPGEQMVLRHQHRLGRQDGGGGERQAARHLPADNLFAPLGMTSTAFKITPDMRGAPRQDPSARRRRQARAADGARDPAGARVRHGRRRPLLGTAGDYLKFVRMILNRGKANGIQVLKPETVDLMSQQPMGDARVRLLKTAAPPLSNDAEFFPGVREDLGA